MPWAWLSRIQGRFSSPLVGQILDYPSATATSLDFFRFTFFPLFASNSKKQGFTVMLIDAKCRCIEKELDFYNISLISFHISGSKAIWSNLEALMVIVTWHNNSVDSKILLSLIAYLVSGHILDGCSWRRVLQSYDNNETVAQADASCPVEKSCQKTFQKSPHNSIKTKTCRQEYAPFSRILLLQSTSTRYEIVNLWGEFINSQSVGFVISKSMHW